MEYSGFKQSLVSISVAAICMTASQTALAEQAEVKKDVEVISVTGSRIKRQAATASPVQDIDLEALHANGSLSLGEVLQELPSVGSSLNGNGSAGTSHGTASLNLRNLGANRSLVLVNGHRWVNGAGTRGFRDFVDMNTIPQAIIKRVEVLQDGATAIYGADAIAGVVNLYTYDDFEGLEVKTYYGETTEGDKETFNVDLLTGTNLGEANLMFAASYVDQKPVYTQDRELTAVPLNGLASSTPEGFFIENNLADVVDFSIPSAGITRNPGADGNTIANWRAVNSDDKFNRYDNNYVIGPSERTSVYTQLVMPVGQVNLKAEAMYNLRESDQQFSPALSSIRGSRGFYIPDDSRVNPFGVEFSGSDFRHSSFFMNNDYRVNEQKVETTRFALGLDGEVFDGWTWDSFVSYAKNKGEFTSNNQMHLDKLALGMRACDTTGIEGDVSDLVAGCVPVNIFNPLTEEMVDYVNFTGHDENEASQVDFTANISGFLYELPAGDIGAAFGIEYRKEKGEDTPDSTINSDPRINTYRTTSSSPREGTVGEYDLKEAYAEFSIPLLADKPFVEYLELSLATRYSDYSTFGSTTNSKIGLLYTPFEQLSFRANWAEGFRAPSILELFEGQRLTFSAVSDPCSADASLPGCSGVPAGYTQPFTNVQVTTGGNRQLVPETSENKTVGLIYESEFIENFSFTLDWYEIEIDNTISEFGAQNNLDLCAYQNKNCDTITRDSTGEIMDILDGPVNLNATRVSGIDFVSYYSLQSDFGDWSFNANISKLNDLTEYTTLSDGSVEKEDLVGTAASRESYPEWRGTFSTTWKHDAWSANYNLRYIDSTTEQVAGEPRGIGAVTYHNVSAGYQFENNMAVKLGINNLGDKQPPSSLTNLNINFDQNTYNPTGRFVYMQLTYKL
ncbi:TonB-dependent receptor [Pseudoalteromonas sp. GB56]